MDEEKRNTLLFFILSLLVLIGYPYFFENNQQAPQSVNAVMSDTASDSLKNTVVEEKIDIVRNKLHNEAKV